MGQRQGLRQKKITAKAGRDIVLAKIAELERQGHTVRKQAELLGVPNATLCRIKTQPDLDVRASTVQALEQALGRRLWPWRTPPA